MTPPAVAFAAAALIPAMTAPSEGTPQLGPAESLVVALCNGGSLTLPLGPGSPSATVCCAKGCGADKRRRIDRKQ
jgi:hypothetical protein